MNRERSLGVGAQNDLGGTKVLPEKWLESCLTNRSFFLFKLRWPPKKKNGLHIEPVFLSNLWWSPKKKKVFTHIETVFLFFYPALGIFYEANILLGKKTCPKFLMQYCPKNIKSPEILTQNCPKYMKLPKIWTPYTNRRGAVPFRPPSPTPMERSQLIPVPKYKINIFDTLFLPAIRFIKSNCNCNSQRWSRGHKARGQGQGHKKKPRPRPRTAFPRTDTLEAKDRNARGQGQGPRTQAQVLSEKKRSSQKFFRRSPKKK